MRHRYALPEGGGARRRARRERGRYRDQLSPASGASARWARPWRRRPSGALQRDEVLVTTKGGYLAFDHNVPSDPREYFMTTYIRSGIIQPGDIVGLALHDATLPP